MIIIIMMIIPTLLTLLTIHNSHNVSITHQHQPPQLWPSSPPQPSPPSLHTSSTIKRHGTLFCRFSCQTVTPVFKDSLYPMCLQTQGGLQNFRRMRCPTFSLKRVRMRPATFLRRSEASGNLGTPTQCKHTACVVKFAPDRYCTWLQNPS